MEGLIKSEKLCGYNTSVECGKGRPDGSPPSEWNPHAKCLKCGWNPDVARERKEKLDVRGI